jgi:hypothetical protein
VDIIRSPWQSIKLNIPCNENAEKRIELIFFVTSE